MSLDLEYQPCPLCRSDEREIVFHLREPFALARCTRCGLHYLYPRVVEGVMRQTYRESVYYGGGSCGYADASYVDQEGALRATFKRLLGNLHKRGLTGGKVLEVGCGYGYLLDEARLYFDERVGTEFSPEAAEIARGTGAEVYTGGIEQLEATAKFDCVVATQVIEHVYEPLSFVKEVIKRVKPGGAVVLATPDVGGMLRKVMQQRWPSLKVPEHVVYFDFRTLVCVMLEAGLSAVQRLPYPHAFPLGLIAAKFGITLPKPISNFNVWVPATTVAAYGRVPSE